MVVHLARKWHSPSERGGLGLADLAIAASQERRKLIIELAVIGPCSPTQSLLTLIVNKVRPSARRYNGVQMAGLTMPMASTPPPLIVQR